MTEYIQIDDTRRLVVEQDTDAENPTSWGDHVTEGDDIHTRWADGEVYGVTLEHLVIYTAPDGRTKDVWEEPADADDSTSLWGCYLDDDYTARHVAAEYFGIPLTD